MSRLPRRTLAFLALACQSTISLSLAQTANIAPGSRVQAVRFWSFGDVTRVAIQTEGGYRLAHDQIDNPARAFFDLTGLRPPSAAHRGFETIPVNDRRVKQIRVAPINAGATRVVFDLEAPADIVWSQLVNPDRLMVEIRPKQVPLPHAERPPLVLARSVTGSQKLDELASVEQPTHVPLAPVVQTAAASHTVLTDTGKLTTPLAPAAQAGGAKTTETQSAPLKVTPPQIALNTPPPSALPKPATTAPVSTLVPPPQNKSDVIKTDGVIAPALKQSTGDSSLVRVFGLKLTKVVIDAGHGGHDTGTIGRGGLLEKDLVLDVALRLGDLVRKQLGAEVVYTRSEDVFIPLEERTRIANEQKADLFISIHANSSPEPSATGVETYYFNFTSDKASVDLATRENAMATSSISDLNDLLHRAVLQTKLEESREFAQTVQSSLWTMSAKMNGQSRNRGVRQAPFVVLIGATMPSILAEIGFVSNTHDEKLMRRGEQRQKIAEALFKGVAGYANSLSHTQLARIH